VLKADIHQVLSFIIGWVAQSLLLTMYIFLGGLTLLTVVSKQSLVNSKALLFAHLILSSSLLPHGQYTTGIPSNGYLLKEVRGKRTNKKG
jgi:hypothetical protein